MTQTPLEREEAAATLLAGAAEGPSTPDPSGMSHVAKPWGEPIGGGQWAHDEAATLEARAGPVQVRARINRTPKVLAAVGLMVGGILLTTAALVWVATTPARRRPFATALGIRRR